MLSEEERAEIERVVAELPKRQSAAIDALKAVQASRGWVSDEAIHDIASVLGMSPAELDSVATFYSLIYRQPVGKHVIHLCDSVSCWIMGEESILDYLQRKLGIEPGQTTSDGMFTLLPNACLGHCEQAPAMMLDGEIIGNLTPERIDEALDDSISRSG